MLNWHQLSNLSYPAIFLSTHIASIEQITASLTLRTQRGNTPRTKTLKSMQTDTKKQLV
ncbi:hypothetical protein yfred0001_15380 [Yersinia frederiksenii ATCC 33641]|nr:hypothetical protein yfred0001_15380 [Yersinia frederiksenii ATCC 33641]